MKMTLLALVSLLAAISVRPAHAQEDRPTDRAAWFATPPVEAVPAPDVPPTVASKPKPAAKSKPVPVPAPEPEPTGIREVRSSRDPIHITTKLRFNTMIILPEHEQILDVMSGDKELWAVTLIGQNMIHLKPRDAGIQTNLMLVTATGAVYTFWLREGRADGKPIAVPDFKVTVLGEAEAAPTTARKYVPIAEFDALQAQLLALQAQVDAERQQVATQVDEAKSHMPLSVKFPFEPIPYVKPFFIKSAWQDGRFTYFRSDAREVAALYEVKDAEPSIVEFKMPEPGLYVVPKLMDSGYFMLGKARLGFKEQKGAN